MNKNLTNKNLTNKNSYFLLSFLPALAYWILETHFSLEVALIGGLTISVIEMIFEKFWNGHVHALSKLNFGLILLLGSLSLFAQKGIFFKLQPTFTGIALSLFLFIKKMKNQSLFLEMLNDMNKKPLFPESFFMTIETHMIYFLFLFSLFMIWISFSFDTSIWLFWKTIGFYFSFFVFIIVEFLILKRMVKKIQLNS